MAFHWGPFVWHFFPLHISTAQETLSSILQCDGLAATFNGISSLMFPTQVETSPPPVRCSIGPVGKAFSWLRLITPGHKECWPVQWIMAPCLFTMQNLKFSNVVLQVSFPTLHCKQQQMIEFSEDVNNGYEGSQHSQCEPVLHQGCCNSSRCGKLVLAGHD